MTETKKLGDQVIKMDKVAMENLTVAIEVKKFSKKFMLRSRVSLFVLKIFKLISPMKTKINWV